MKPIAHPRFLRALKPDLIRAQNFIGLIILVMLLPLSGFPVLEQILSIPPESPERKIDFGEECLKYEVKWNGFRSAEAWVCIKKLTEQYQITGYTHTIGFPRVLWRMDSWGKVLTREDFSLVSYQLSDREPLISLDLSMSFDPKTKTALVQRLNRRTSQLKSKRIELYQGFDPAGLASLIRTLEWSPGQSRYFEFTDAAERYVILIKAGPIEEVQVSAGRFKTIRLEPFLFRVPRSKNKEKPSLLKDIQELKSWKQIAESVQVWMALSGTRPYVLVKGNSFIGEVTLELTELNAQMPKLDQPRP